MYNLKNEKFHENYKNKQQQVTANISNDTFKRYHRAWKGK